MLRRLELCGKGGNACEGCEKGLTGIPAFAPHQWMCRQFMGTQRTCHHEYLHTRTFKPRSVGVRNSHYPRYLVDSVSLSWIRRPRSHDWMLKFKNHGGVVCNHVAQSYVCPKVFSIHFKCLFQSIFLKCDICFTQQLPLGKPGTPFWYPWKPSSHIYRNLNRKTNEKLK